MAEETFLEKIELSVRAANCLRRLNPGMSMEEFMMLTKPEVMRIKNAGVRTWREVAEVQASLRGDFRRDREQEDANRLAALLGEVNNLLMNNPRMRVVVNVDSTLTLVRSGAREAEHLSELRRLLHYMQGCEG